MSNGDQRGKFLSDYTFFKLVELHVAIVENVLLSDGVELQNMLNVLHGSVFNRFHGILIAHIDIVTSGSNSNVTLDAK